MKKSSNWSWGHIHESEYTRNRWSYTLNGMNVMYRHTSLCCTSLYWVLQILHFLPIEGSWPPCIEQVCRCHFPTVFAHFMSLRHLLVILTICQTFVWLYLSCWSVISDYDLLKVQMVVSMFFSNKVLFVKVCTSFFRLNAIAHLMDCSVNITFLCTGKPEDPFDLLYCNICFIAVVWNWNWSISKMYVIRITWINVSPLQKRKMKAK